MRLLLACGEVNPDEPENCSRTPLWWAASKGHEEVVKLLLARDDVNPDKPDVCGQTPLCEATHNGHGGVAKLLLGQDGVSTPGGAIQVEHSGALLRAACGGNSSSSLLPPCSVA